jgi:hypothetical protein
MKLSLKSGTTCAKHADTQPMTSSDRHFARDISYVHAAQSLGGRAVIRALESATGRLNLILRAVGYQYEVSDGADFWQVMVDRYGLSLDITGGSLETLPESGLLVVVSNHPYGILDDLMMGGIQSTARQGVLHPRAQGFSQSRRS